MFIVYIDYICIFVCACDFLSSEAIELLQGQADMSLQLWKEWLQKQNAKLFENIVQMCDGVESARKMSDMLISIGAPCLPALNAFFDKVLES